jgi:hypothetical protein
VGEHEQDFGCFRALLGIHHYRHSSLAPWFEASAYRHGHCAPGTDFNPRSISVLVWAPAGVMRIGAHCAVHPFERFAKFQEGFRTLDG